MLMATHLLRTRSSLSRIHMRSAADLIKADFAGLSDPYAIVRLPGHSERRTATNKHTLNPVWDEELTFKSVYLREILVEGAPTEAQTVPRAPLSLSLFRLLLVLVARALMVANSRGA